ncbi:HAD family hydrolase [Paenibacillus kobensis]|uniref:HAD family hydrolase n=1 Tax=Paenibacillus kobensis TaxID=59841 RepID=UPI000FD89AD8|nr:HAD hydrolase-like protein [Paenibacillus kobensis]
MLHVGDSLVSDIQGAQQVGIAAAWMNRKGKALPDGMKPDFVVSDFDELKVIL